MKPPKPTEGVARHCWGKRRRAAKKIEKGLWRAMDRLGILKGFELTAEECSWEERFRYRPGTWNLGSSMRRPLRRAIPYIAGWSPPSYGCDDWSEWPVVICAHTWIEEMDLAPLVARGQRHALRLLRQELRERKHRIQAPGQRGEG